MKNQTPWIAISSSLPPLEEPVWLYLPDIKQPVIGVRTMDDGGWTWGRCYDDFWWSNATPGWITDSADVDDLQPSHWQAFPLPPTT